MKKLKIDMSGMASPVQKQASEVQFIHQIAQGTIPRSNGDDSGVCKIDRGV
jgi:hypothetical protein